MPLWALIALAAGTLQTGRNALARSLAFQISPALNFTVSSVETSCWD